MLHGTGLGCAPARRSADTSTMTLTHLAWGLALFYAVAVLGGACRAHRWHDPALALLLAAALGPVAVAADHPAGWGAVLTHWPRAVLLTGAASALPLLMLVWQTLARPAREGGAPPPPTTNPT